MEMMARLRRRLRWQVRALRWRYRSQAQCGAHPVRHNHYTRDIKPGGQCPACDLYRLGRVLGDVGWAWAVFVPPGRRRPR